MTDVQRRRACLLLPLFSLRHASDWGTGEISDIPRLCDWAAGVGFSVLQLLPVNEVSGGESSPYAAASAFALDPVYLGLDACPDFQASGGRGKLPADDQEFLRAVADSSRVDWKRVRPLKMRAMGQAFSHFYQQEWKRHSDRAAQLERYRQDQRSWLADYTLFAVLHEQFGKSWLDWPEPLRDRHPPALEEARQKNQQAILQREWMSWQLDDQWRVAREAAREKGVDLMGDLPFVVGRDSADVWAGRDNFRVDLRVGTPPDAFSETGQDWGLPAYDWQAMARNDFSWMRARAARAGTLYALYRVDHVIGLYRTYFRSGTPRGEPVGPEAKSGFMPAEEANQIQLGEKLIGILNSAGDVVAEDLGTVPPFLRASLTGLGVPGFRVLRWEKGEDKNFCDPSGWPALSVAATSTHDVESLADWYDHLDDEERGRLGALPTLAELKDHPRFDDQVRDALLRLVYASPSVLVSIPLEDALGGRGQINVPGTVTDSNWTYRMPLTIEQLQGDQRIRERLIGLARDTNRLLPGA